MKGLELIIIFKEDEVFLTKDHSLNFVQVGLKDIAQTSKSNAYWEIRVLKFHKNDKKLFCEVLSYNIGNIEYPPHQKEISEQLKNIETLSFWSIKTDGLLRTLKTPSQLNAFQKHTNKDQSTPIEPKTQVIEETFFIPLKRVQFKQGCISFDREFKELNKKIELTINNDNLREEFEAVKNYFANVLNTKKINVTTRIEITNNDIISINTRSPEIEQINKDLIDNIRFEFIKSIAKRKHQELDENLFSIDEYFNTLSKEGIKSLTTYSSEEEMLEDLLRISNTKHFNHLRFLSKKHAHKIMRLRFVYNPFSFIFLIEGDKNYHVIWETLDTAEATYIWHIEKDLKQLKKKILEIGNIINQIRTDGKSSYINSTQDTFRRVFHDYSELNDGFIKWKDELESILT